MRRFLLIAFTVAMVDSAAAQEVAPCGGDHAAWLAAHADDMSGLWTDTPVMGLLVGQPMPLGPPEPVRLTAIPNGFSALGEEPVRTYELLLTEDPLPIDPPGGASDVSRLVREAGVACAFSDLPKLTAAYTIEIEGQPARGTIAGVIASTEQIHIWFQLDTDFGQVTQLSTMTR